MQVALYPLRDLMEYTTRDLPTQERVLCALGRFWQCAEPAKRIARMFAEQTSLGPAVLRAAIKQR